MEEKTEKKEAKAKPKLLYKLKIWVNDKEVGLKPFIFNTLGKICESLLSELKDISDAKMKEKTMIIFDPRCDSQDQVKVQVGALSIELNDYVQDMIWKTIVGFLWSLKDLASSYDELKCKNIIIEYERK
jgi:hypothetical protein